MSIGVVGLTLSLVSQVVAREEFDRCVRGRRAEDLAASVLAKSLNSSRPSSLPIKKHVTPVAVEMHTTR